MSGASDWAALARLADAIATSDNPVTKLFGRHPPQEFVEYTTASCACIHDDEREGAMLSDGAFVSLND